MFVAHDLKTMPYREAHARQHEAHAEVAAGGSPQLLLVEHPAVITLGRRREALENVVISSEERERQGIEVVEIERGGDVTYHGPGQLVAYAVFPVGRRVRDFLRLLENATIETLARLGIDDATPNPGYAGVYVPSRGGVDQKIASIGVAVKRHVALHGVGLNVSTRLDDFSMIIPCGLDNTAMTSVEREHRLRGLAGEPPSMDEAKAAFVAAMKATFADYDFSLPSPFSGDAP